MKIRSVSYLTKEGVKNLWVNRLMTAASVGVLMACMVLIGLAVLVSMNVNKALGNLEQQNVITAGMRISRRLPACWRRTSRPAACTCS